jgi:hypothetical protein
VTTGSGTVPPLHRFAASEAARACAAPAGAYANCLVLSVRYTAWLRECGVAAGLLVLRGSRTQFPSAAGRWPYCDPSHISHWTTVAGDWSVDWTARQFDPRAAWPRVEPVTALAAAWEHVSIWACERCAEPLADPRHGHLAPPELHAEHRLRARETAGIGPFSDPRHDGTPALVALCRCADRS